MFFNSFKSKLKKSYAAVNPELQRLVFPYGEQEYIYVGTILNTLFKKKDIQKSGIGLLFLMSSVVLLRYMLLNYHSYVHAFFTYRALLSPIFAVFAAVLFCSTLPHGRKEVRLK